MTVVGGTEAQAVDSLDGSAQDQRTIIPLILALVLGVSADQLPGHQLIVDRAGWLRARGRPGDGAWSEDDLVCRSASLPAAASAARVAPASAPSTSDGLGALIRRMDAEPVRLQRGGFPH